MPVARSARWRLAVAAAIVATTAAVPACSTSLEQQRLSVARDGLEVGSMPPLDPSAIELKFAEQRGLREPDYTIVAETGEHTLDAFLSEGQLNRARAQAVPIAAREPLAGVLSPTQLDELLSRAHLAGYAGNDFQVIRDRVGTTDRLINFACRRTMCGLIIIVSTT